MVGESLMEVGKIGRPSSSWGLIIHRPFPLASGVGRRMVERSSLRSGKTRADQTHLQRMWRCYAYSSSTLLATLVTYERLSAYAHFSLYRHNILIHMYRWASVSCPHHFGRCRHRCSRKVVSSSHVRPERGGALPFSVVRRGSTKRWQTIERMYL